MRYVYLWIFLLCTNMIFAQNTSINNFIIKEDLLKSGRLALIAADTSDKPLPDINGIYTFSISGFTQELNFNDGVAILPFKIDKSTFVYLKHENDEGVHSKLIYVFKRADGLNPVTISRIFLIVIPLILIVLAFIFKRFIYIALILFLLFMYFNYSNGLKLNTFFETTFDYLKNLV